MKIIFGSIWHLISFVNMKTLIFCCIITAVIIGLAILHKFCRDDKRKMVIWRILCLLPAVISAVHFYMSCKGIPIDDSIINVMYFPSVLAAMWIVYGSKKITYVISTVMIFFVLFVCVLYSLVFGTDYRSNFTRMSYTESFKAAVSDLKENYVLTDWKEIDFDEIESEILPLVEEAEKNQDAAAFAAAISRFKYKLYDGHVRMEIHDSEVSSEYADKYTGNDYGFSMVTLDDGQTIAVVTDTDSEAYAAGIHDGTRIVKWDGVPVDEAKADVEYTVMSIPVVSNEEFMKAVFLAGSGGNSVNVTFINDDGQEKDVSLQRIGSYYGRYRETAARLFSKGKTSGKNYSCRMISDTCAYMLVTDEEFSSYDDIAYCTGNHIPVREAILKKMDEMKSQGMKTLVIDMRNNNGGYDDVALGYASLFADKDYFGFSLADRKGNSICDHYILKSGEYADMKVVVLVNMNCISAGDGMALYFSKLPNVTIMGMTNPNGSNQEIGGSCYFPEDIVMYYPVALVLDQDGNPNIDAAADRVSRNPVDVHIPLTYDAAMQIFSGEGDYEVEYAVNYLQKQ